jgi:phospholipid transport system transporter-binding protein
VSEARLERGPGGRFRLSGVLSFYTVPKLWRESESLFGRATELEIDLRDVSHSDSAGVALLVEWMRAARARDLSMRYFNIPAQMLSIARVSSLDHILPLAKD